MNYQVSDIIIFLVGEAIMLIGIGVAAYTRIMAQMREFEIRIGHVEKQDDAIIKKLDEIQNGLTTIHIELNNKKNRD